MRESGQAPERVESINPYRETGEKGVQVEAMFDNIASAYDFMNTAMSFGLCRYWRDKALRMLSPMAGAVILDMATGTGDVAIALAERYAPKSVTGIDLSEGMLDVARGKTKAKGLDCISFSQGDCLDIKYADNTFDYATIAYGVRNFSHLSEGLKELQRVIRPGGKLCIIELSVPRGVVTAPLYGFYSRKVIPMVGRVVSGDSRAYTYLPESIAACPQREAMAELLKNAGFRRVSFKSLTFGVVTVYIAEK